MRRELLVMTVLIFALCFSSYAGEVTMQKRVISEQPYIVEETFFVDGKEIAKRKYRTDFINDFPQQVLIESKGEIPDETVKEYYSSGNTHYERNYKEGQKHGLAREYYKNGKVKLEVIYEQGKMQGEFKEFYPSGVLKNIKNYIDGVIEGITKQYSENGKLTAELTRDRGEFHWWMSKQYQYYGNGNLSYESSYNQKTLEGFRNEYYENGQKSLALMIIEGKINDCKEYDRNGQPISNEKGEFECHLKYFYPNKNIEREELYINGKLDKINYYDESGNLKPETK